ncbi:MAG: TadE/TadG family type IV pilus assembly protein [Anaerolineales bacterium]
MADVHANVDSLDKGRLIAMKAKKHTSDKEKGQSLLELAVVFTLLMLILAGVADLGRAFFTYIALRDAAQEGAAFGSIYRIYYDDPIDCDAIVERTKGTSNNPVDLQSGDILVNIFFNGTKSCNEAASEDDYQGTCIGNEILIEVKHNNFTLVTPFLGSVIGTQTIPIRASVKDSILTPPCPPPP